MTDPSRSDASQASPSVRSAASGEVGESVLPVAIDAMGGDLAPDVIIDGARLAAAEGIAVVVVGPRARLLEHPRIGSLTIVDAADVVPMGASPVAGLRDHPDSSVHVALGLVQQGRASAAVSCGNTGAFVVEAVRTLHPLPGVERVALAVEIPLAADRRLVLLDVGATVEPRAEHLVGFARLGHAWAAGQGGSAPRVGLLSNGEEAGKGTQLVRDALELAAQTGVALTPIEPGPAFAGEVEVLVCDGFTGNILLKTVEATADMARGVFGGTDGGDVAHRTLSWQTYGGALLLGVHGVVVIGHGRASADSVLAAIRLAATVARQGRVADLSTGLAG